MSEDLHKQYKKQKRIWGASPEGRANELFARAQQMRFVYLGK
jgi:hypothetical protein